MLKLLLVNHILSCSSVFFEKLISYVGGKNIMLVNVKVYEHVYKDLPLDSVLKRLIE
jgi:hypothetical protein